MDHSVPDMVMSSSGPQASSAKVRPRLIVMSNRAPIRLVRVNSYDRIEPTVGGVGATFLRLLEQRGGCWIAWSGGQAAPARLSLPAHNPLSDFVLLKLDEREVSE